MRTDWPRNRSRRATINIGIGHISSDDRTSRRTGTGRATEGRPTGRRRVESKRKRERTSFERRLATRSLSDGADDGERVRVDAYDDLREEEASAEMTMIDLRR
jgi:hypothetical protein